MFFEVAVTLLCFLFGILLGVVLFVDVDVGEEVQRTAEGQGKGRRWMKMDEDG